MAEVDLGIPGLVDYKEIGSGGFATVFSAVEPEANRRVAVKVLAAMDEVGQRRFDRERRTMGQTTAHDNIVTMFRSGYTDPGHRPYLVMEHMPRGSLQDHLDHEGPLGVDEAIEILLPVIDGLGFAHSAGIVHKDVKPANILISATGSPKLSDFGIAGIRDATGTSQMAFSLLYTPPETFDATTGPGGETSDPRDERSDLYSVAATLYTLVTGAPLFPADSQAALMRQIITEPPPRTGHAALDGFLATALAKDPNERFPTAAQFSAAFRAVWQQGRVNPSLSSLTVKDSVSSPGPQSSVDLFRQSQADGWNRVTGPNAIADVPSIDGAQRPAEAVPSERPHQNSPPTDTRKRRTLLMGIGAVVIAIAVAVAFTLLNNTGEDPIVAVESSASTAENSTTTAEAATTAPTAATTTLPEAPDPIIYTGHTGLVWAVDELADGRIASGSPDNTVQVWDPADPATTQATYTGHSDRVVAVVGLSDGRVASAGWGSTVHVWDPADPGTAQALFTNHQRGVEALVELADGRIASASTDATVQIWDPADPGTTQATYSGHTGPLRAVVELSDGRVASASDEAAVHVWDPADPGTAQAVYTNHQRGVEALVELSDGRIASASDDATVHVWDPADPGTTEAIYTGHTDRVMALVELADGRIASASTDATVQVWDPDDPGVTQAVYSGHTENVLALVELSDRRIASASDDATVHIWDPANH